MSRSTISVAALRHTEGLRDGGDNECRIGERCQIDEDGAIGKGWGHIASNRQREPRLADATGTGQGQQRHALIEQERPGAGTLHLPANEPGARNRGRAKGTQPGGSDHAAFSTE